MRTDYLNFALKSLKERKLRSWLTMLGIFIGIAAVVSLIGLGEGLRNAITSQFNLLGTDVLTIQAGGIAAAGPPGTAVPNPLKESDETRIAKINGIKVSIGRIIDQGKMDFNDEVAFVFTGSISDGDKRKEFFDITNIEIEKGRNLKDGDRFKVILGSEFQKKDRFGKPINPGDNVEIQGSKFEVVGIMKRKGSFIVDNVALMNIDVMRDVFDNDEDVNVILARVKKGSDIKKVKSDIEKLLRKTRDVKIGEEDFTVESAEASMKQLNSTLFAVQVFVYLIAAISLLVGGIGIMNTMYTSVLERTRDIGIMKSIGAKNSDIFTLFFIESGLLGSVGGIVGVILGVTIAKGLAALGSKILGSNLITAKISLGLIIGALIFSFVIGTVSGLSPALKAAKLHPVDALSYRK